jgi:two-component system, chemotaxis family, protein-glutamate methylesterase/glutaminase
MAGPPEATGPDERPQTQREVVVVGASAGGVEALARLAGGLPQEFPAAVFVVLHMLASGTSVLDTILGRSGWLPATMAVDGERFERGHIYVAPPDQHLLLWDGQIRLTLGPRENGHRPAIDPLFRSAARSFGARAIAVVLSGSLDDGAAGLRFVDEHGGATVVQEPEDALYPDMPANAIAATDVDRVVPVERMADVLCELVEQPTSAEAEEAGQAWTAEELEERAEGDPSGLTCPECGGSLWQREEGGSLVRFACRTGHAYSPESLVSEQSKALETAMWSALRGLEERADLFRRMARRAGNRPAAAHRFESRARAADRHANVVREAVSRLDDSAEHEAEPESAA